MSVSHLESEVMFPVVQERPDAGFDDLLKLRTALVLEHPLTRSVGPDPRKLFLMFELYANFVYDFTEYVCRLFIALHDADLKAEIYENVTDEIGIGSQVATGWKAQHGELYRQFVGSLRGLESYQQTGLSHRIDAIEKASKSISRRFYEAHAAILDEGDDLQSFAAFSTIECWVCDLYAFWKRALIKTVANHDRIDMRTIDLHCICDAEHSAALDELLRTKLHQETDALHRIRTGVVRGMVASERLFSDIFHEMV